MLENAKGNAAGVQTTQHFNDGFNIGARAGYEWGPWRLEEEFSLPAERDRQRLRAGCYVQHHRQSQYLRVYDQPDLRLQAWLVPGLDVTPHIGAGIGAVNLHDCVGHSRDRQPRQLLDLGVRLSGHRGHSLQYQPGPGVRRRLPLPGDRPTRPSVPNFAGVKYTSGYSSHSVLASLSVRFGAPPPPVVAPPLPPAPPPMARKVFLVFFDWDRDTITPEGMAIIQQAAAAFRSGAPVTIQVTGYADRSGSPGYNQRLSERRANNVASAMVRIGVPRQQMAVSGRGENDNRVPTADGVREPQNRRVEIVFP